MLVVFTSILDSINYNSLNLSSSLFNGSSGVMVACKPVVDIYGKLEERVQSPSTALFKTKFREVGKNETIGG